MLRFVIANTGVGKTSYCTARFGIERMHGEYARRTVANATKFIQSLNANGFKLSLPPKHLVYTFGFGISVRSWEFGARSSWELDATKIGFALEGFAPQYVYPYSTLIIDEMQEVFDSRNWQDYSENISRYFEQCRKLGIEPIFIAQADNLGELRIRQLCEITLIRKLRTVKNRFGEITKCIWDVEIWDRYDEYKSGKHGKREQYVFHGNIFDYFDTTAGKERFFYGIKDFETKVFKPTLFTPEGIKRYVEKHPITVKKKKKE